MITERTLNRLERQARRFANWRERVRLGRRFDARFPDEAYLGHVRAAAALKAVCPHFDVLIDVGAHMGRFAQAMCSLWDFDEVVCVEPNVALHRRIGDALAGSATILGCALGAEPGQATYFVHPDHSMNSLRPIDRETFSRKFQFYGVDEIAATPVEVRTLEWVLENLRSRSTRDVLLKLDTQGSELDILRSGGPQLARVSACIIEQMFWEGYARVPHLDELVLFMREVGFQCRGVLELEHRRSGEPACADFLFRRIEAC